MLTDQTYLGFKDVLIKPAPSDVKSRKEINLTRKFTFKGGIEKTFTPVVGSNMIGVGTFRAAKVLAKYEMLTCIGKRATMWDWKTCYNAYPEIFPYVAVTVGLRDASIIDSLDYNKIPVDIVCCDVANGYQEQFVEFVSYIKSRFPNKTVIAGNVATSYGAEALWEAGADIVKIGIGSGSVCTTRFKTGVGVPQISAITDGLEAHRSSEQYIMSDGGCTGPGDIAKAFVAGADFVMIGGMLAGTKETGVVFQGNAYVPKDNTLNLYRTSEGKQVNQFMAEDLLEDRLLDILGGLRSAGAYMGKKNISDWWQADLVRVNEQTNDWFGEPK